MERLWAVCGASWNFGGSITRVRDVCGASWKVGCSITRLWAVCVERVGSLEVA